MKKSNSKFYKGRYHIVFYSKDDEEYIAGFNNIEDICRYKDREVNKSNLTMIRVELNRALKNINHETYMLDNKLMHVYLIDMFEDNEY